MSTPTTPAAAPAAPAQTATPTAPAAQAATPQAEKPRMLKVKVDGKEMELSESEVIAGYSHNKVASQRFQEAAKLRQEAEAVLKFAKENPAEFFNKTGMNARDWAETYLIGELKKEAESPEQRKARENEEQLKEYQKREKEQKERDHQERMQKLQEQHMQNYDTLFTEALGKSGLPKTAFTVKRMAELQLINVKKNLELSADQLAKVVREDYISEQKALMGALDGDQLIEFLGVDAVKKLSKAQIAKLKSRAPSAPKVNKSEPSDSQGLSWSEYKKRNRRFS